MFHDGTRFMTGPYAVALNQVKGGWLPIHRCCYLSVICMVGQSLTGELWPLCAVAGWLGGGGGGVHLIVWVPRKGYSKSYIRPGKAFLLPVCTSNGRWARRDAICAWKTLRPELL